MAEARVLVLDANDVRAQNLRGLLQFIDYAPVVHESCATVMSSGAKPADWVAIVIGEVLDTPRLEQFVSWLSKAHERPVLLLLPEQIEAASQFEALGASCRLLELPLKYMQLNDLLKFAGLQRMQNDAMATVNALGPTGNSSAVRRVRRMIEQVAGFDTTVFITGESGTGKEVIARAIHAQSHRADKPFVAVHCGAIPAELIECELFGQEAAANAVGNEARPGRFDQAEGGTLFLDEVGDMSLPMQVKLLRVLQEHSYERIGGTRSQHCDVRIIAATHGDMEAAIAKGRFREDLYYRLNVFPIEAPPMRERLDDLPMLVADLIARLEQSGHGSVQLDAEALNVLRSYAWPGNVRELANLVERLAVLHPGECVRPGDLPRRFRPHDKAAQAVAAHAAASSPVHLRPRGDCVLPEVGVDLKDHIEQIELSLIRQALVQSGGVVAHTARLLNTRRTTLVEKLRKYGLQREDVEADIAGEG